ncbi:MAG: NAD(P) transhydrogenase subunit alpha [Alphaproteobacteria bacterium]|nr:NAD(P) transhydrogenase subunit alpha [Alphaproteobacteria bacterium]
MDIWFLLTIFMLSCFIGYFVIWRVTPALYSPLMSVSNAISGIIILGGIISLENSASQTGTILSYSAIFFASINIFGGFAISQRMLNMFKTKGE